MAVTEAIILAGGLGTRLRSAVPDLPKCMAPVAGRPFIAYVIDALRMQGVERFVFSLGYKAKVIKDYLKTHYPTLSYDTVTEAEPLGTGGGMLLALKAATTDQVLVANGDTLFRIRLDELADLHGANKSECTLALKPMRQFDRYGVVEVDEAGQVLSFQEKRFYDSGLINGGLYVVDRRALLAKEFPEKFSFEKEYLEPAAGSGRLWGSVQDGYFIDIGIPEDFEQAGRDLARPTLDPNQIDNSWTLFLDRDGVINREEVGTYVLKPEGFAFNEGVPEALRLLARSFGRILVVSNQRGVGRGLMTLDDLMAVHQRMEKEVSEAGGRIDRIYFCTEKEDTCFQRKPNPGMAYLAAREHPSLDLARSIMVGNKPSDMRFGRAAGLFTVFVATTNPEVPFPHPNIDLRFNDLLEFARWVEAAAR